MKNLLYPWFKLDVLNGFIGLFIILFFVLTLIYSFSFMKGRRGLVSYYPYITLSFIAALGVVFANNLILMLVFWGFLGLTLYLLVNMGDNAASAAKKALIIVGGSDAIMLLGIGIIYYLGGSAQIDGVRIGLNSVLPVCAYLCIAIACFAKAGAMPFHSWIPDCAKSAPTPVVAFLPASLDKLLGIYLLARISLNLFVMNQGMNMFLMLIGAFTIIAAVMMALVQHNMKKLLGYHAVSQVGYMVLGIGTGNPIGIAGGLFHMLNNAIYKSCLFFTSGNVERQAHTVELDKLGGLAKGMPVTYICALIASLSISGIPPFNGFFSKWMIYQGVVENFPQGKLIGAFCLSVAMFGSGLTLASFMKLLHAVYLGRPTEKIAQEDPQEAPRTMLIPIIILSSLCVIFGIFSYQLPLKYFIYPAIGVPQAIHPQANANTATIFIILGIIVGLAVYYLSFITKSARQDNYFTGGEEIPLDNKVSGTEFYNTIKELRFIKEIYKKAESGAFDIYEQSRKIFSLSSLLQNLHNGVLPTYLVWMLLGMAGLFLLFVR